MKSEKKIAVLIPCYNEEAAIGKVVRDFKESLPEATVYVYDNNSNDKTVVVAKESGAVIGKEMLQGKGYVVKRMFADINADIYILVDGDDTYDPNIARDAVNTLINERLDMINISRDESSPDAYRPGHRWGNVLLTSIVRMIFGAHIKDMLSGYRVFSCRYVKSFPSSSTGFEIETELTVHALELGMPISEIKAPYKERPEGSTSKLSTYRDGFRILMTIGRLVKDERPLLTFFMLSLFLFILSMVFGVPIVLEYMETGLVPKIPTAVMSVGIMILSFLSLVCGLILDTVTQGRREVKRFFYLSHTVTYDNRANRD